MSESKVVIDKVRVAADSRGFVFEPLDAIGLQHHRNVHVVWTEPGAIRGNHFHTEGDEVSTVVGPARVCFKEAGAVRTMDVPAGEGWRFRFPAGVTHAFQNTGDRPMLIASFNTLAHDPENPLTTRDVIL